MCYILLFGLYGRASLKVLLETLPFTAFKDCDLRSFKDICLLIVNNCTVRLN